jgi:hypothetical protein
MLPVKRNHSKNRAESPEVTLPEIACRSELEVPKVTSIQFFLFCRESERFI